MDVVVGRNDAAGLRMSWVDISIFVIISLSVLVGVLRGFVREALSLLVWALALWVALEYTPKLADLFADVITSPVPRLVMSFVILFLVTLILGGLIGYLINKFVRKTSLSSIDRSIGMFFGLARGVVIIAALVMLMGVTPLVRTPWWEASVFVDYFQILLVWVGDVLPHGVARSFIERFKS